MKAKKKISLKWRIFAAFSAFLLILLAALWLCQTVFLNSFYKAVKVYETKKVAAEAVEVLTEDSPEYRLAQLSNRYDVSIKVLDADFSVLYSASGREMHSFFNNIPESELYTYYQKARDADGSYSEYFEGFQIFKKDGDNDKNHKSQNTPTSFIIAKVVPVDGGDYTVLVNTAITPVDSVITTLRVILITVTLITVLAALIRSTRASSAWNAARRSPPASRCISATSAAGSPRTRIIRRSSARSAAISSTIRTFSKPIQRPVPLAEPGVFFVFIVDIAHFFCIINAESEGGWFCFA